MCFTSRLVRVLDGFGGDTGMCIGGSSSRGSLGNTKAPACPDSTTSSSNYSNRIRNLNRARSNNCNTITKKIQKDSTSTGTMVPLATPGNTFSNDVEIRTMEIQKAYQHSQQVPGYHNKAQNNNKRKGTATAPVVSSLSVMPRRKRRWRSSVWLPVSRGCVEDWKLGSFRM